MRVISGKLKGRTIKGYNIEGTRPTMDRFKESIFAMIQNNLSNSVVLDLFAGSGNYGIEAISNGANIVYFNDNNKKCLKVIEENLINFNVLDNSILLNMDYMECLKYLKNKNIKFDLIFLDPPYKEHIIEKILNIIDMYSLLNNNGLVICEALSPINYSNGNLILYKERSYGDKKVFIYRYNL